MAIRKRIGGMTRRLERPGSADRSLQHRRNARPE
jgi:hypothetical protein